jgi:type I restriction enzyme, S subunit
MPRASIASADYLRLALQGAYSQLRSISDDSGSTKGALTCADLSHFRVALPPLPEQGAIWEVVESENRIASAAIDRATRQITLLDEYRARLIAEVVTGKVDVREAAVRLPDETEELDPITDMETAAEETDGKEGSDLDAVTQETEA